MESHRKYSTNDASYCRFLKDNIILPQYTKTISGALKLLIMAGNCPGQAKENWKQFPIPRVPSILASPLDFAMLCFLKYDSAGCTTP